MLLLICLLLCCGMWSVEAQLWPGPRSTSFNANGEEVWISTLSTRSNVPFEYLVRDIERPTLVYNCRNVPALCRTVKSYLGSATSATFHYDRWAGNNDGSRAKRKTTRRNANCPSSWVDTPRADGSNRCPEPDQPSTWKSTDSDRVSMTQDTIMMQTGSGNDVIVDRSQLAKKKNIQNERGEWEVKYEGLGAALSCDEFPAASWIEGGVGSSTYWFACDNTKFLTIEQDWQAAGHGRIQTWFKKVASTPVAAKNSRHLTIYKFDFKYVDEDNGDAVWLERGGNKLYCYGPSPTTSDLCKPDW